MKQTRKREQRFKISIFIVLWVSMLFMEFVYHVHTFGFGGTQLRFLIPITLLTAAAESLLLCPFRHKKAHQIAFWMVMGLNYLLYAVQLVYHALFAQPLLMAVAVATGGEAITDFGIVGLRAIWRCILPLIFLALPIVVAIFLMCKGIVRLRKYNPRRLILALIRFLATFLLLVLVIAVNFALKTESYQEYQEVYAVNNIIQKHGVMSLFVRDISGDILPEIPGDDDVVMPVLPNGDKTDPTGSGDATIDSTDPGETQPVVDRSPNVLDIDFDALMEAANSDQKKLVSYLQQMTPSNKNEYTGMFAGYNLIYITAEAFSPYAISEELTPTLYMLTHSGVVVDDYYVPLGSTSTSDGEYMNLFGQIPAGSHNFRNSANNTYPYSLPAYFAAEGVKSYAYHSNSLSYYDRYITHPNLGYDFKAAKLGSCSSSYSDKLFQMEGASSWPNSDYELFKATISEYISEDRFHVYYMTMSGHANYSFTGNAMSYKNRDLVADLDCSEEMKAYIACNLELEKAMRYLLDELENAGKLDNTVIVLSADHYPYGLTNSNNDTAQSILSEFVGEELDALDVQKNCLILWNSKMETVTVNKTCCSVDIMPTLLNLFGFDFDSRLFAGRDILSDSASLVIFTNKSFITDYISYNTATKEKIYRTDEEVSDEYFTAMKSYVDIMFKYSKGMLTEDFQYLVSKYVRD